MFLLHLNSEGYMKTGWINIYIPLCFYYIYVHLRNISR